MNSAADIDREAAEWLIRRQGDAWTPGDQEAFDRWIAGSTANRIAVIRLETVWNKAARLRASALDDVRGSDASAPSSAAADIVEHHEVATERRRRRWLWPVAIAASLALVSVPVYQNFRAADHYATGVGGYQQVPLADGSRADLNTGTELAVSYSDKMRRIRLGQGEAFFKVAKNRSRPFIVEAGDYRVIAVGTAFTVRLRGREVDVVVTEGRVRIEGPEREGAPPVFAAAGQAVVASRGSTSVRSVPESELDGALGWREGLLIFEERPLSEVAAEFNRYNRTQLAVDPSAANVVIDGSFRANNVAGFVRLLQQGFGVTGARDPSGRIELKKI